MKQLMRDTTLGELLRLASGGRVFHYAEERDPSLWKRYIDVEKSGRMAHHGTTEEEKEDDKESSTDRDESESRDREAQRTAEKTGSRGGLDQSGLRPPGTGTNEPYHLDTAAQDTSELTWRGLGLDGEALNSADTRLGRVDNARTNDVSGVPVDPEKGRDVSIVTWYGDNDPEVCSQL